VIILHYIFRDTISLKKTPPSDNLFSEAESDGIHPGDEAWEIECGCREVLEDVRRVW